MADLEDKTVDHIHRIDLREAISHKLTHQHSIVLLQQLDKNQIAIRGIDNKRTEVGHNQAFVQQEVSGNIFTNHRYSSLNKVLKITAFFAEFDDYASFFAKNLPFCQ
jgi:hypothetical protein